MSVKGKKKDDWVARTMCDFGELGRETELVKHYSLAAAFKRYRRIWDIYHKLLNRRYKIWIELR